MARRDDRVSWHLMITVEYPKMIGGEVGRFWSTEEIRTTLTGILLFSRKSSELQRFEEVMPMVNERVWRWYRKEHDFDDRLPEACPLKDPVILFYRLVRT